MNQWRRFLMPIWRAIGRQLQNPRGFAGGVAGSFMQVVNHTPNTLAVEALAVGPSERVLELGCGPGCAIARMASLASNGVVYGIDQSPVMLEQAERRNRSAILGGRVVLLRALFERLPFPDDSFDATLAVNVAYFWDDSLAALREVRRVLRPGGRLAIYATDVETMREWKFAGRETHRHFDAAALARALHQSGFSDSGIHVAPVRLAGGVRGLIATAS